MTIKKFILYFFTVFLTQKMTVEEKQFSLLKRAGITSCISATAFITQKLLKSKKLSAPLKFLSFSLPGIYTLSHIGYTYVPTKYLTNIFNLTHKLCFDEVFFLSSPSQIFAKRIKNTNLKEIEQVSPELLSETLFYLPRIYQKAIILDVKNENLINKIAKKRTDIFSELIKEMNMNEKSRILFSAFLSKLTIEAFETIGKKEYKKFDYNTHIKNIFNLELFENDKQKIDFLKNIYPHSHHPDELFFRDYINDTTTDIQLLMNTFQTKYLISYLKEANRLHEILSLLNSSDINSDVKKSILDNIKAFLESNHESHENKIRLRKFLEDINKVALWKEIFPPDDKEIQSDEVNDTDIKDKFNTFETITKDINLAEGKKNEDFINEIFTYEIENFINKKNPKFIPLSFLIHPTIANKIFKKKKEKIDEDITTNLLTFYTKLIFEENKDEGIDRTNLLLNIQTIFHEIDIPENNEIKNNEIKNLVTLLKKDISEILKNEPLKEEIKNNDLYKKFLFNQIMTKKKKIETTEELESISTLLNLNEEQEAILITKHKLNYSSSDKNKKTKIENIIESNEYKKKLRTNFTDFKNLAKKIFFEGKNLSEKNLEDLSIQYEKKEEINFSDYEIENIAISSFFKINEEKTTNIINKLSEEKNKLLEEKIEKFTKEHDEISEQLKSQNNLLTKERIFIESINSLDTVNEMLKTLTIEDLTSTLLNNHLAKNQAIKILNLLIRQDRKKARNVVKLMQKINNNSFQKLYIELDEESKINLTKEN